MEIKQKTITNVMLAMNEFNEYLKKSNKLPSDVSRGIVKKYGLSTSIFYDAVAAGYFTRIDRAIYKANIITFHPIDARNLYIKILKNKHHNKNGEKFFSSHRPKKRRAIMTKIVQQEIEKTKKAPTTKKRYISLFWGLIKYNY